MRISDWSSDVCSSDLIDREPAHVWKPMLHTIAAGTADTGANQTAYLVQAQQRGFRFEMGEVMAVDRAAKQVLLAPPVVAGAEILPPRSLPYDTIGRASGRARVCQYV